MAKTTLVKWTETPVPIHSHLSRSSGGGSKLKSVNKRGPGLTLPHWLVVLASSHVFAQLVYPATIIAPTATLLDVQPSILPPGLPTLRSHSPDTASSSDAVQGRHSELTPKGAPDATRTTTSDRNKVPPMFAPAPRSSLRSMITESVRMSIADSTTGQSIASRNLMDTSTYSRWLDVGASAVRRGRLREIRHDTHRHN